VILGVICGAGIASLLGLYLLGIVEDRADLCSAKTRVALTLLIIFLSIVLGHFLIGSFGSDNSF
jgi:hypothetical protein